MKLPMLAAVALFTASGPAVAGDRSFYGAIEGGVLNGRDNDLDYHADYSTVQAPSLPATGPADREYDDVFRINYRNGTDAGALVGYDFGPVRLEVEVARKRAAIANIAPDELAGDFLASVNDALNRPSSPGLPALTAADFDLGGKVTALSAMVNGLVDIGITDRLSIYGGAGYGGSRVSGLGDSAGAKAWQKIFGLRYAISPRFDLGLKYRYFASGAVALRAKGKAFAGNPDGVSTTDVELTPEYEGRFRTRSYLASLIFKFGRDKARAAE